MTIGFNQTLYEVSESWIQALISVTLLNGILQREAIVSISITEDTAKGMKVQQSLCMMITEASTISLGGRDFIPLQPQQLTFDAGTSYNTVAINIIDNDSFERDKQFSSALSTMDMDVTLSPAQTTIRILNDDGRIINSDS